MIILDFGSGNSCQNNKKTVQRMYDNLDLVDSREKKVVVKWQLFERWSAGKNTVLRKDIFDFAYEYGIKKGYMVTASVGDIGSLRFLMNFYDTPFVKLKNDRTLDYLMDYIPEFKAIFLSRGLHNDTKHINKSNRMTKLWCVSKYPADYSDYDKLPLSKHCNISDHTANFDLYHKYQPDIYECHYKLHDTKGLDSGVFARTPEQLMEVL